MTELLSRRVSIPEGVMMRELSGESVLLNINTESYFGLDDVGTRMWAALTTSATIQEAFERLLAEYEVEPDQLKEDLSVLVQKLADAGLVIVNAA